MKNTVRYSEDFVIPREGGRRRGARSAERSDFIISSRRAVREPRMGPSELQARSSHLYLYISDSKRDPNRGSKEKQGLVPVLQSCFSIAIFKIISFM